MGKGFSFQTECTHTRWTVPVSHTRLIYLSARPLAGFEVGNPDKWNGMHPSKVMCATNKTLRKAEEKGKRGPTG